MYLNTLLPFSAVVKQVTDLDVAGQLPPEAEIQKMVDDLKNGIKSLDLQVNLTN